MKQLIASLALGLALTGSAFAQMPTTTVPAADVAGTKAATNAAAAKTTADVKAAKADAAGKAQTAGAAAKSVLDLNTASESDLAALPGVGVDNAKKIIAARPFSRKDQLVSKKLLTKPDYAKIKDLIIAKQPGKK